jgi:hypothetical protein
VRPARGWMLAGILSVDFEPIEFKLLVCTLQLACKTSDA